MITIREATDLDAPAIRELFLATYGRDYPYSRYYDVSHIIRMVYSEDTLLLVAEDSETGQVIGTASVILEVGAYSDLVGEFGRLVVHPDARNRGAGKMLLEERLRRVEGRLHVGIVEARLAHPYTLKIAEKQQFAVVGFFPMKMKIVRRESLALMVRYFGEALDLRNNHPRLIPEVHPLAHQAMENCGLTFDGIVDEESAPYPQGEAFDLEELSTQGYAPLMRIERGRVRGREIFGPMRLHYGIFKIQSKQSTYLLARERGRIVGAAGIMVDPLDRTVRIFELISLNDHVIRFLLGEVEKLCREKLNVCFIELDVSAYSPRMQRTLLELGFLPVGYVPALVFHEVERLDVVKMAKLLCPLNLGEVCLNPEAQEVADIVLRGFRSRQVLPRIAQAVQEVPLFSSLNEEQRTRLAGSCTVGTFAKDEVIFRVDEPDTRMYILLQGDVAVHRPGADRPIAQVGAGECLGEVAMLTRSPHSATAIATTPVEAAVLNTDDLGDLVRMRPDIGVVIYKNLAVEIGTKLRRTSSRSDE